ncbi:MAG: hypothetical protein KJ737_21860 [Proteobacteria bacterium]|nr:hypothetical protein [Pseudomonadota bacterium]
MIEIFYYIIGIMLLALGRKLFWLFIGCVGFVAGLQMAQQYFGLQPAWMNWLVAAVFGLTGAFVAVFFQTIAIGFGGFAAGITITAHLMFMSAGRVQKYKIMMVTKNTTAKHPNQH